MKSITSKKINDIRSNMISLDLPRSSFIGEDIKSIWNVYDEVLNYIVPAHGQVVRTDDLYINDDTYIDQEVYRLESCKDGYEYLIHIYHYSDAAGFGVELFSREEL